MDTKIIREFIKADSSGKTRLHVEFECDFCKKIYVKTKNHLGKGKNFCSKVCSGKFRKASAPRQQELECAMCHIKFPVTQSRLRQTKSGLRFCSMRCKGKAQRIEGGIKDFKPSHYGSKERYRVIAFKNLPNQCNVCNYKDCIPILEVHHKDSNKENNDISNLEILCPTHHSERHFLEKSGKYKCKKVNSLETSWRDITGVYKFGSEGKA